MDRVGDLMYCEAMYMEGGREGGRKRERAEGREGI